MSDVARYDGRHRSCPSAATCEQLMVSDPLCAYEQGPTVESLVAIH